jgi:hypothetical protein
MTNASCDVCGRIRESTDESWYTVHFGCNDLSLLATASQDMFRRLGQHHACSRVCLEQLVRRWAKEWQHKQERALQAHASN